jgi:hypothetical protein
MPSPHPHPADFVQAMLSGSYMVIVRKHSEIGVGALLGVVVSQALGYGLVFDVNFFFRYRHPSVPPVL